MPKKTYLMFEDSGRYLILDPQEACRFIENLAADMDADEKYVVSTVALTQKEFNEILNF